MKNKNDNQNSEKKHFHGGMGKRGVLLVFFGWMSLTPNRPYSIWICCFIGIWISMAPLIFWAPTAVAYLNGTLVGALVIALTILIPGMPNMVMYMKMGAEVPQGWS
jgi:hypothetical protein